MYLATSKYHQDCIYPNVFLGLYFFFLHKEWHKKHSASYHVGSRRNDSVLCNLLFVKYGPVHAERDCFSVVSVC